MTWARRHNIPVLLAIATLLPISVLSWLAFRVIAQERDAERQRGRERIEIAAGRVALDIDRRLQGLEEQLAGSADESAIQFRVSGLEGRGALKPVYQPSISGEALADSNLEPAQFAEFQQHDLATAAAFYRRLAGSPSATTRGAALIGLARVLRQLGDREAALIAYARLQELDTLVIAGQPAGLVARQGRCKIFEAAGAREDLRNAAEELAGTLNKGGWFIDRATFDVYREMLDGWSAPQASDDILAKTDAAIELWRLWRAGDLPPRGRRVLRSSQTPVLAVWSAGVDGPAVWLGAPPDLLSLFGSLWTTHDLQVALSDAEGQPLLGERQAGGVILTPAETRLPFILSARSRADLDDEGGMRRVVLVSGLGIAFLLMLAAAYGLYRATTREMGLAREQADFVSAVSHEFRTPLTSMRHLTELLVSRGVTSEERRAQYYGLLAHETERLHRLVESLLSFGRIEGGAFAWQLEIEDAGVLVTTVVEEFRREPLAEGRAIVGRIDDKLPSIRADREALCRALWNLLENAGKYSEHGSEIHVFARRQGQTVLLGVGDHGAGIPVHEHKRIFQKFVRGEEAKRAGVPGVGIGLALVKQIVEAHGGEIQLESEPGRGSTFTMVLPCHEF